MYTIVENARIVLSLLKAHNIRHIVLSPGGSNIPIVQGVQDDPFFKCYSVVDERSALYVAIGLHLQTGEIIATSCTSAQATRNYIPGLTEAFYKHVPILAITMSKHPKYLGQEYMQCPIQTSLPEDCVKKSYSLPRISTEDDRLLCVRRANEAILELTHHSCGPVQLNIEALDSETWSLSEEQKLPDVRVIKRYDVNSDISSISLKDKRVMILIGEHRPFESEVIESIECFCETNNAFVYTTHISNYHGKYSLNAVRCNIGASEKYFNEFLKPDIVITIGGVTGDYDYLKRISNIKDPDFQLWRVSPDGNVIDTYGKLTKVFQMRYQDFFIKLNGRDIADHEYFNNWKQSQSDLVSVDFPFGNIYAAQQLHSHIPANSYLNFAILNSFRSWLFFDVHPSVKAFCNVAAFGIDGCLSAMIGQSFATDELCFLITGDLSFYYDMNAIALRQIRNNVRILIVNNNGGAEFKINTVHTQTDVSRYIAADNHFKNAKAWAECNGFKYLMASSKVEFNSKIDEFVSCSDMPIIFEIFTNPENERNALYTIRHSCLKGLGNESRTTLKDTLKNTAKSLLGESAIKAAKKLIK